MKHLRLQNLIIIIIGGIRNLFIEFSDETKWKVTTSIVFLNDESFDVNNNLFVNCFDFLIDKKIRCLRPISILVTSNETAQTNRALLKAALQTVHIWSMFALLMFSLCVFERKYIFLCATNWWKFRLIFHHGYSLCTF